MRILIILSLILIISAFSNVSAATMHLSGDAGKAILASLINGTLNQTINASKTMDTAANQVNNASAGGLWSWGTPPAGYVIDKTGNLVAISGNDEWLPSI